MGTMNVIKAVQLYLEKIVDESGPGMKVLLMDRETVSAIFEETSFKNTFVLSVDEHNFDGLQSVGDDAEGRFSL